jgi:hypothetical protein
MKLHEQLSIGKRCKQDNPRFSGDPPWIHFDWLSYLRTLNLS